MSSTIIQTQTKKEPKPDQPKALKPATLKLVSTPTGGFNLVPKIAEYNSRSYDSDSISSLSISSSSTESFSSNSAISRFQRRFLGQCKKYSKFTIKGLFLFMFLLYTVYFTFAVLYNAALARSLIIITIIVCLIIVYAFVRDNFGDAIYKKAIKPLTDPIDKHWDIIKW